ncbi:MAG: glycosyltransferase family 25 protein [Saezia sp.]
MEVFVINLLHRTDKRDRMIQQSQEFGIPVRMFEAVNGNELAEAEVQRLVHDFPACALTKGVIGCALSHVNVYKKMLDENISLALVLEDDAVMKHELKDVLGAINQLDHNDEPMVYLLSSHYYEPQGEHLFGEYSLSKFIDGSQAHAYVLNLKAAESLHKNLLPVLWEADKWYYFQQLGYTQLRCVVPHVLDAAGEPAYSDLFGDRSMMVNARRMYLRKLKKLVPWREKIRKFMWKATKRPFVKKS